MRKLMQVLSGIVHGGFLMLPDEIRQYIYSKNFERNEAIWVLKTVDNESSKKIAKLFNISVEEVDLIVKKHQEYWDETRY